MHFPSRFVVLSALVFFTDPRSATTTPNQAAGRAPQTSGGLRQESVVADARPEELRRWMVRGGCRRLIRNSGLGLVLRGGMEEDAMDESGDGEEEHKVPQLPIGDEVCSRSAACDIISSACFPTTRWPLPRTHTGRSLMLFS